MKLSTILCVVHILNQLVMFRTKVSLFCLSVNPYTIQKDHPIILSLLIHHFVGLCRLWFLPGHLHYQVETPKKPCFLFAALSTLLLMSAASASYSFFFEAKCAHQLVRVLIESLQSFCLSLSLHVPDKSAAAAALCVTGKSLGRINMLSSSSKVRNSIIFLGCTCYAETHFSHFSFFPETLYFCRSMSVRFPVLE